MTIEQSKSLRKPIFGFGINDADYVVGPIVNGKQKWCPFYAVWVRMITRSYDVKTHDRQPTYKNVSVCVEWLSFMNFKSWMESQDWQGKQLDKDVIKPGNKIYSPETCCFISHEINSLLNSYDKNTGLYPPGVHLNKRKNKFMARCRHRNKNTFLGYFSDPDDASSAYVKFKKKIIIKAAASQTNNKIKAGLLMHSELVGLS